MATFNIIMPKMGESIQEATITKWFVKVGDKVEEDDTLLEIATDKVDSEVPSPVDGIVTEVLFKLDDVVPVGVVIAVIELADEDGDQSEADAKVEPVAAESVAKVDKVVETPKQDELSKAELGVRGDSGKFYSPVVRKIAGENDLTAEQLDNIKGTGLNGRVNKEDVLAFLDGKLGAVSAPVASKPTPVKIDVPVSAGDEIIEMDRMRKIIAQHMVTSKQISPHVTSVVEADVTNLVLWRKGVKDDFQKKYGHKLTFMPIFTEAVAKALRDFPMVNSSVDGDKIIVKKDVNVGIAVSLPSGNLIVPVIKNTDTKNLAGLAGDLNSLADKARNNKLGPDEIQGGTFTITNFGSFNNLIGTPIINQPQVAILATGAIQKKVSVIETPAGDTIGIRQKMYLSLSYDHRIVDGMLGGLFLRKIADYLEQFDPQRTV